MAFRTIEISNPAEIHIKSGQLHIEQEAGIARVPIEDVSQIFCIGSDIRISTMALSILSKNKVVVTTLDDKYLPTAIVLPYQGNARQSQMMHKQVRCDEEFKRSLWVDVIRQKIHNQAGVLEILGLEGAEKVLSYALDLNAENVDYNEALAAKEYFSFYHPGLNRRVESPINSRLNYGYAIVRSAIVRCLISTGFHPTFGIHHNNQLNAFNFADDLIEPWRPMIDILAYENVGNNIKLNKEERGKLARVLYNSCMMNGQKMSVGAGIEIMCESLKKCFLRENITLLKLPTILGIEVMELINE